MAARALGQGSIELGRCGDRSGDSAHCDVLWSCRRSRRLRARSASRFQSRGTPARRGYGGQKGRSNPTEHARATSPNFLRETISLSRVNDGTSIAPWRAHGHTLEEVNILFGQWRPSLSVLVELRRKTAEFPQGAAEDRVCIGQVAAASVSCPRRSREPPSATVDTASVTARFCGAQRGLHHLVHFMVGASRPHRRRTAPFEWQPNTSLCSNHQTGRPSSRQQPLGPIAGIHP